MNQKDLHSVLKNHLAVKDQSGSPDPSKRSVQFYLADVRPGDWRFGSTSDPQGGPARQARLRTKKGFGKTEGGLYYDEIQKLRKAIGLKSASPTNSRTTSKMMAPTTTNKKRKDEKPAPFHMTSLTLPPTKNYSHPS